MKSIIQEASSIAKAIEQGLIKADNPRDFSIKILEYPERNFFGLTTKPAKIALYYDERGVARKQGQESAERPRDRYEQRPQQQQQARHHEERRSTPSEQSHKPEQRRDAQPQQPRAVPPKAAQGVREQRPEQDETPITPRWNQEMVTFAEGWLTKILHGMQRPVKFQMELNNLCLRITFDEPLFDNPEKERRVLASLSLLLLETSKHTFKVNLRGHKVVLTHRAP